MFENLPASKNGKKSYNSDLQQYSEYIYNSLFTQGSIQFSSYQAERIKKSLFDDPYDFLYYENLSQEKKSVIFSDLLSYSKALIDHCEISIIDGLYSDHFQALTNRDYLFIPYISQILIYLLYICKYKTLPISADMKKCAEHALEKWGKPLSEVFYFNNFDWLNSEYIENMIYRLESWQIPLEVDVIMDNVVIDFYIFTVLYQCNSDFLYRIIKNIAGKEPRTLYRRIFKGDMNSTKQRYKSFVDIFYENCTDAEEKIELLKSVLEKIYAEHEIDEGIAHKLEPQAETDFSRKIKTGLQDSFSPIISLFQTIPFPGQSLNENIYSYRKQVLVQFLDNPGSDKHYKEWENEITLSALHNVLKNNIAFETLGFDNRSKLSVFFNLLRENKLSPDLILGGREQYYGDSDTEQYKTFLQGKHRFKYSGSGNYLLAVASKHLYVKIKNIDVKLTDYSMDDILNSRLCKVQDASVLFNVGDGIFYPFDKTDLLQHFNRINRLLTVAITAESSLDIPIVGCGFELSKKGE